MSAGSTSNVAHLNDDTPSLEAGRAVLLSAANALSQVAAALDGSFEQAVRLINTLPSEGRVVISGMGKAGFIAMKISSTLASIGTPSFFLHPAEAVHGDLGRYTKHDVAIILSNSGETGEILKILTHIKRIGCPIIAITSEPNSALAKHSEVVLSIGKVKEAGPLGLAPTTSTTAMLAVGDALAMAVLSGKSFSPQQFATLHPGGHLGRCLTLVTDIMRRGASHCIVSQNLPAREVLHLISATKGRPGAASVVDEKGALIGIFTDGDLRRCLERQPDFLELPISQVMTTSPKVIADDKLVEEALHLMSEFKIDQIVVVSKSGQPVGMIDIQDLVEV